MLPAFGLIGLCVAFLLPGHYPPWVAFEQEATAAAGCGLIAIAWLTRRSTGRVAVPPLALLLYACASIPLFQWAAGQIRFAVDGVLAAGYLAAFATAVVVGANGDEGWRRELADGLGLALIAAGIVSTGLATAQWLRVGSTLWVIDLLPGGRPYANLAQPNHLSTLLALAMAAALERYERQRLGGGVTALAVCWLGFGLVMTRSRTGWLFVMLLVCWWLLMRRRVALRLPASAVIAGVVGFAALTTGWSVLSETLLLSGETLNERLRPGTRLLHWQTLWDAIGREPWLGYGWQQVGLAQQAAVLDHPASGEWLEHSHNLLLDLLIWNGIPIGLLLAVALIVWFVRQVRACRSTRQWALLLGVIAVFTHALLEYPLDYLYFLLPLALMMGLLEGDTGGRTTLRLPTAVAAAAVAAQLALLVFVATEYLQVQEATRQLRFTLMHVASPSGSVATVPAARLLDAPRETHRFFLMDVRRGMAESDLAWMRDVAYRYPTPAALMRYALATGMNGHPDEAVSALGRLCKMHPVARCEESREAWSGFQQRYPVLRSIAAPAVPQP